MARGYFGYILDRGAQAPFFEFEQSLLFGGQSFVQSFLEILWNSALPFWVSNLWKVNN